MTKSKKSAPRVGDTAWFVEWCYELAFDDEGDYVDRDACKNRTRRVGTRDEAVTLAKEAWVKDDVAGKLGHVCYWPAEFVPYEEDDAVRFPAAGYWKDTADAEYYEGDE